MSTATNSIPSLLNQLTRIPDKTFNAIKRKFLEANSFVEWNSCAQNTPNNNGRNSIIKCIKIFLVDR